MTGQKVFQCIMCPERYSVSDIGTKYFPSTGICRNCYIRGQQSPYVTWCFGKPNKIKGNKVIAFGYDPETDECKSECPDRMICKIFVKGVKHGKEKGR